MNTLLKAACACIAIVSNAAALAATPADWKAVDLLDGRLTATMPPSAQAQAVRPGIMAGESPRAREERISIDLADGVRLAVLATELFRLARPDMAASEHAFALQVRSGLNLDSVAEGPVYEKPEGLAMALLDPPTFTPMGESYFIAAALVRQKDGSLQSLAFFTNEAGAKSPRDTRKLVAQVTESLVPGSRPLRSGGTFGDGWPFEVELAAGYTAYAQRGPDFSVYWLVRLSFVDEPASELGIYVGSHPHKRTAPANALSVERPLLGEPAQWWFWLGKAAQAETFFHDAGPAKLSGHAFVIAGKADDREALLDAVSKGKWR